MLKPKVRLKLSVVRDRIFTSLVVYFVPASNSNKVFLMYAILIGICMKTCGGIRGHNKTATQLEPAEEHLGERTGAG